MNDYRHIFGPVPSRRLGLSLGIDLTPFKTCSFDCVFCQLGRTTVKTVERREYVSAAEVTGEIDDWLKGKQEADYITLSGSGEPTLNSGFGGICEFIRSSTSIPLALLTNASLMNLPEVREAASRANTVKASLSAWNSASLEQINRPHEDIRIENIVEGLRAFREEFKGQLWLEIFLIEGINADPKHASKIAEKAKTIRPDRIQLNTAVRPPAEEFARAVAPENMAELTSLFEPEAEITAEFSSVVSDRTGISEAGILAMLERRPCTMDHIGRVFGMHKNEVSKYIGRLLRQGRIIQKATNGDIYYTGADKGNY